MVFDDGVGELLEEDGLAGLGWRNDEAALAHADGTKDVHHPHRQVAVFALELDAPLGVAGAQVVERDAVLGLLRLVAVQDRKSTRLNSSHGYISYAVFCLKK